MNLNLNIHIKFFIIQNKNVKFDLLYYGVIMFIKNYLKHLDFYY